VEIWQALLLGLVEGLTEFLPVSSTGHLLVVQRLLGIEASEAANAYVIVIQVGAIAAVLGLYRQRIAQMLAGLVGRDPLGRKLLIAVIVGFLPAAIAGVTLDDPIERYLFGPWPVVVAWAIGGVLLLALAPRIQGRAGRPLESIDLKTALIIGVAQCAALWPGTSRSLATILGGLASGLSLPAAVEFSFLLGLVTLGAASAYKLLDSGSALLQSYGALELIAGFITAGISAWLAVRWMVAWLSRRGLGIFGWWRLIAAAVVSALLLTERLAAGRG
jgi:undecaprenyl-diphosphatase